MTGTIQCHLLLPTGRSAPGPALSFHGEIRLQERPRSKWEVQSYPVKAIKTEPGCLCTNHQRRRVRGNILWDVNMGPCAFMCGTCTVFNIMNSQTKFHFIFTDGRLKCMHGYRTDLIGMTRIAIFRQFPRLL